MKMTHSESAGFELMIATTSAMGGTRSVVLRHVLEGETNCVVVKS